MEFLPAIAEEILIILNINSEYFNKMWLLIQYSVRVIM